MPHINHIPRPVRNAPALDILTPQNKPNQRLAINPVRPPDDLQAAQHPPAVAHVLPLLGPPVQPAAGHLALGEPRGQLVDVRHAVQAARDGQRRDAREDLARVRLGAGRDAVAAVEVGAGGDVLDGLGDVDEREQAEERQRVEGAVEEARVLFAPFVAGEGAGGAVLEVGDDYGGGGGA